MKRGEGSAVALRDRAGEHASSLLLGITAVALLVRLHDLGERVAHWDEARVAYDALRYGETGLWEYRPIVHGPFLPHVNDAVFAAVGASDFSMRLVVALVGGLLPLAPWLFRRHLRDLEVVAIGGFLAFDPVLVYYSRFMRNDVLVATFMLFSLGAFVRFADTRRIRYLYAGFALAAFGFATKENAVVYLACWLGAGALVADTALFRPYARRPTREYARDRIVAARDRLRRVDLGVLVGYYGGHLALAFGVALALVIVFYAPRTGGTGVGFERLASRPDLFPAVADRALTDFWGGIAEWGEKSGEAENFDSQFGRLREYVGGFLEVLAAYSAGLVAFALVGAIGERYLSNRPRPIVLFFAYWGVVSVPGYAVGMDVWAAWGLVHALVPLSFPAGVALGRILAWGLDAVEEGRNAGLERSGDAVLAAIVLALLVTSMAVGVAGTAFDPSNTRESGEHHMVQYAQPQQDVRATLEDVETVVEATDDPVVFFGDGYAVDNESAADRPPVHGKWIEDEDGERRQVEDNSDWYRRLPLPWYLERSGAERASADDATELERLLDEEDPVVIVTMREHAGNERIVDEHADGYVKVVHEMRSPGTETVFYVRADALEAIPGERRSKYEENR